MTILSRKNWLGMVVFFIMLVDTNMMGNIKKGGRVVQKVKHQKQALNFS
jgi:hypothetical protein